MAIHCVVVYHGQYSDQTVDHIYIASSEEDADNYIENKTAEYKANDERKRIIVNEEEERFKSFSESVPVRFGYFDKYGRNPQTKKEHEEAVKLKKEYIKAENEYYDKREDFKDKVRQELKDKYSDYDRVMRLDYSYQYSFAVISEDELKVSSDLVINEKP
jgi:N-methylhydantoinase A/oxoprolinase/acetone carboxylase beta subunit